MPQANDKRTVEERVLALAAPLVAAEGMELVEVEFVREQPGWILRVFIDKQGGVNLDDCSKISHVLDPALDVEDFIAQAYHLEVSSPGLNRPLRTAAHFEKAVGKLIKVKTFGPIGEPPRKNFKGTLQGSSPESITVDVEGGGVFTIPMKDIAKANLEFEF